MISKLSGSDCVYCVVYLVINIELSSDSCLSKHSVKIISSFLQISQLVCPIFPCLELKTGVESVIFI